MNAQCHFEVLIWNNMSFTQKSQYLLTQSEMCFEVQTFWHKSGQSKHEKAKCMYTIFFYSDSK